VVTDTPESAASIQEGAIRGSLWTALHTIVSVPLTAVSTAVLARILGPAEFGFLALLLLIFTIGSNVTNLGVNFAAIQWGAASEARGERALTKDLLSKSQGFRVLVQWPLLTAAGFVALRNSSWVVAGAFAVATGVLLSCIGGRVALAVTNRTATIAKVAMVANVVNQVLVVAVAVATDRPESVFVSRIAGLALGECLMVFAAGCELRRSAIRPRAPRRFPVGFSGFSRQLWLAGVSQEMVYSRSEVPVLRAVDKNVEAGLFALAFGVSYQITAPVDSLLGPLLPASASLTAAQPGRVVDALRRSLRYSSLLAGIVAAVLVPAAYFAVPYIYGSRFEGAALPFLFLAWVSTMQSVCIPVVAFLAGRREARVLARANILALVADVILAIALIPRFGLGGALVANAVGQAVSLAVCVRSEAKHQGLAIADLLTVTKPWLRAPLAAGVALAAGALGRQLAPGVDVLAAMAVGLIVFSLLARFRGRPLTAGDREVVVRVLPRRVQASSRWVLAKVSAE
jgi:O-antigen/teichoic acid export membrane protein